MKNEKQAQVRGSKTAARTRIRDAAMELFAEKHFANVTVSEIARAAGVFPNQITYHYGSKDALYIDAAFALLLRDTERLQSAGRRSQTPESLRRVLAKVALNMPSIPVVVGALAITQSNPSVQSTLRGGLNVLFRQSERYLEDILDTHGWTSSQGLPKGVKTFWSAVFGAVLMSEAGFPGGPSDIDVAATLDIR